VFFQALRALALWGCYRNGVFETKAPQTAFTCVWGASMQENLKAIVPRLIWSMFACISGWHGIQMLWGERPITGMANILICLGWVVLAVKWPAVVYYFAPSPIVLRTGTLVLILSLGIAYLPFLLP
jgi:hypothetical protein